MKKIKTILVATIIFGMISCSKGDTAQYKVKLINNTHFSLDK